MKKTLLLFIYFLTATFTLKGQIIADSLKEEKIDKYLEKIDKSKIVNGILYDRVYPVSRLDSLSQDRDIIFDNKFFIQAFSELSRASSILELLKIDKLEKDIEAKKIDRTKIDIGIINVDFSVLNYSEDEKKSGLKLKNEYLEIVDSKDPFIKKNALIISPILGVAKGNSIQINFGPDFIFQESDNPIKNLSFEIDGQIYDIFRNYKIINPSVIYDIRERGEKLLKFNIELKKGASTLYARLNLIPDDRYSKSFRTTGIVESGTFTSNIPFKGYEETSSYYGFIEYKIFYRTNEGNVSTLKKPFIIIDGFDPMDTRRVEDEDCLNDPKCVEFYESDIANKHESIVESMFLVDEPSTSVLEELRSLGYDVIIVNQPTHSRSINNYKEIDGGADYIERNALTHVGFYQYLNNLLLQNGSMEKLVIAGPSMGGQISRYALAYMEKNSIPHNTRLWISIDSPHKGANIPPAVQANVSFLAYNVGAQEAKTMYEKMLNSVAARQQLINLYRSPFFLKNSLFTTYYNNLNSNGISGSNGYPINLRKIALVNGSITSKTNGYTNQLVLELGADTYILGIKTKITRHYEHFISSNDGVKKEIYHGYQRLGILSSIESWSYFTNTDIRGGLDSSPGGRFYSQELLKNSILQGLTDEGYTGWVGSYQPYHSFIPTVSALGFNNVNFDWGSDIDRNLICNNEIPFDTYYAPTENQKHTTFYKDSFEWIKQELGGTKMYPKSHTYTDNGIQLSGVDEMSPIIGSQYNFLVNKSNTTIQWSYPTNMVQLVSGQGTSNITLKVLNPLSDFILKATFYDECMGEYVSVIKKIKFKSLIEALKISGSDIVYPYNGYCTYSYWVQDLPTSIPITWEYPVNKMFCITGQGTPSIVLGAFTLGDGVIKANITYNGQLYILSKNISIVQGQCWNPTYKKNDVNDENIYKEDELTIFPNPIDGDEILNINAQFGLEKGEQMTLNIYNQYGTLVLSDYIINGTPYQLKNNRLKGGFYVVEVSCHNGRKTTTKLIVK